MLLEISNIRSGLPSVAQFDRAAGRLDCSLAYYVAIFGERVRQRDEPVMLNKIKVHAGCHPGSYAEMFVQIPSE